MNTFYNAQFVLMALAVGGLLAFAKDIAAGVRYLYHMALTPEGAAKVRVLTLLIVTLCLFVLVFRS